MHDRPGNHEQKSDPHGAGFTIYLFKRLIAALVLITAVLYGLAAGIDYLQSRHVLPTSAEKPHQASLAVQNAPAPQPAPAAPQPMPSHELQAESQSPAQASPRSTPAGASEAEKAPSAHQQPAGQAQAVEPAKSSEPAERSAPQTLPASSEPSGGHPGSSAAAEHATSQTHKAPSEPAGQPKAQPGSTPSAEHSGAQTQPAPSEAHEQAGSHPAGAATAENIPKFAVPPALNYHAPGLAFVEAVIKPMDFELNHRFWGWRPNDIIDLTDNTNNFQLGVLEVTRRTVVQLAERISRTGYNDAFDHNLENAMNWLMIKANTYWFPTPESKYKESLAELAAYKKHLESKQAFFYTRSDNLIPLLVAYEDLLGSCDENLVKLKEADGSRVGFTKADDYFYYAKGVASAMATILEAVNEDFAPILKNRNCDELLHHAIVSCQLASSLNPWIVFNGDLDGVLANHRAHMAAPVSHARFYLGQLIKSLST